MTSTVLNRFNRSVRQLDKVFITLVLIFIALAILVPPHFPIAWVLRFKI